jgi:hypothetical protein
VTANAQQPVQHYADAERASRPEKPNEQPHAGTPTQSATEAARAGSDPRHQQDEPRRSPQPPAQRQQPKPTARVDRHHASPERTRTAANDDERASGPPRPQITPTRCPQAPETRELDAPDTAPGAQPRQSNIRPPPTRHFRRITNSQLGQAPGYCTKRPDRAPWARHQTAWSGRPSHYAEQPEPSTLISTLCENLGDHPHQRSRRLEPATSSVKVGFNVHGALVCVRTRDIPRPSGYAGVQQANRDCRSGGVASRIAGGDQLVNAEPEHSSGEGRRGSIVASCSVSRAQPSALAGRRSFEQHERAGWLGLRRPLTARMSASPVN